VNGQTGRFPETDATRRRILFRLPNPIHHRSRGKPQFGPPRIRTRTDKYPPERRRPRLDAGIFGGGRVLAWGRASLLLKFSLCLTQTSVVGNALAVKQHKLSNSARQQFLGSGEGLIQPEPYVPFSSVHLKYLLVLPKIPGSGENFG
jgi:hypothetical protein